MNDGYCNHQKDPGKYPHTLELRDEHIWLVSALDPPHERDLGRSPEILTAYLRWQHMLTDHSRNEANIFLWGLVTGMQVSLMETIDAALPKSPR